MKTFCARPISRSHFGTRKREPETNDGYRLQVPRLGTVLSEHTVEDGATIFQQACRMGMEGIVSKRLSAPYRSGPTRDWIKVKNPNRPAMIRAWEAVWAPIALPSSSMSRAVDARRAGSGARRGVEICLQRISALDVARIPVDLETRQ